MKLTKNKKLDKRYTTTAVLKRWFNKYTLASALYSVIITSLIWVYFLTSKSPLLDPRGGTLVNQVPVSAVDTQKPFCRDVISCIRDVGESLDIPNQNIMTMIRIGKCESNYREDSVGVNTNRTIDRGVFQLNSIHKDISNQDAFTYELNIRYAYKMFLAQGFNPWRSSRYCWNK